MRPMTNSLREQIQIYIKNKKDISDLIADIDLKGENLSHAVVKYLNRVNCDLRGINWSYCLLGSEDKIFSIIQCDISNSNFENAKFVGSTFIRSCKAHNCNFKNADLSKVDYQYTDCGETSNFCNAIIQISTRKGLGAKFPKSMFEDLCRGWNTKFKIIEDK